MLGCMTRLRILSLLLPLALAWPAQGDAATPCGTRVSAIFSSVRQGILEYLYFVEVTAHRPVEAVITMHLPGGDPRWPNGAALRLPAGLTLKRPFVLAVGARINDAEVAARTTLMCTDLG